MKKKIPRPKGLFSMDNVGNEVHKYDCREISFGGWETATIKSRNQGGGYRWSLFTQPAKKQPEANVNQPIPIDYKKSYNPTIVPYKINSNCGSVSSAKDDDSFANAVLMTCPFSASNDFFSKSLPTSLLKTQNSAHAKKDGLENHRDSRRRPHTSNEIIRERSIPPPKTKNSNFSSENGSLHIVTLNNDIQLPNTQRPIIHKLRGDDDGHFPFRISVSVLSEFAKSQEMKERPTTSRKPRRNKSVPKLNAK